MIAARPMSVRDMAHADAWWATVTATLNLRECDAELVETIKHTEEQLDLAQSYTKACDVMERCGIRWRQENAPLVPLRFPVRNLTTVTRNALADNITRSVSNFIKQLWLTMCSHFLANVEWQSNETRASVAAFTRSVSNAWVELTLRFLTCRNDTHGAEFGAKEMKSRFDGFALKAVCDERARLEVVRDHHSVFLHALEAFGSRRLPSIHDTTFQEVSLKTTRGWWRQVCRSKNDEVRLAIHALRENARFKEIYVTFFDMDPLLSILDTNLTTLSIEDDDHLHLQLCMNLLEIHLPLAAALREEIHRIDLILSEEFTYDHPVWSGVTLVDEDQPPPHGSLVALTPPSHLGVFGRGRAVHFCEDVSSASSPFVAPLPMVRLGMIGSLLFERGELCIAQLGEQFAQRMLALEYAKYESAVLRIMRDDLSSFGEECGVPFGPPALDCAMQG